MDVIKKFGIFTSSQDPQQLSLSVQSFCKILIGLIGTLAAYKGLDTMTITSNLQQFVDITVTLIPVAYATFHTLELLWGLARKIFSAFQKTDNPASITVTETPTV